MINNFDEFYEKNIKQLVKKYNSLVKWNRLVLIIVWLFILISVIVCMIINNDITMLAGAKIFILICMIIFISICIFSFKFTKIEEEIFNLILREYFGGLKCGFNCNLEFEKIEKILWPKGYYKFNRICLCDDFINIGECTVSSDTENIEQGLCFNGIIIKSKTNYASPNWIIINPNNECFVISEEEYEKKKNKIFLKFKKIQYSLEELEYKEFLSSGTIAKLLEYKKRFSNDIYFSICKNEVYLAIDGATILGKSHEKGLKKEVLLDNCEKLSEYLECMREIS